VSVVSSVIVVPTVYLAFKHNADQLSRFVQLTYIIVSYNARPEKGNTIHIYTRVQAVGYVVLADTSRVFHLSPHFLHGVEHSNRMVHMPIPASSCRCTDVSGSSCGWHHSGWPAVPTAGCHHPA
jgi:hypothetical protein